MPAAPAKKASMPTYPKDVGACIDKLYKDREARLNKEREVEALKASEADLKRHIIGQLNALKLEGGKGKVATASRQIKRTYVLAKEKWAEYWEFARKDKTGSFVEKRIAVEAVGEAFAQGKRVPGVTPVDVVTLSISKVGALRSKAGAK